MAFLNRIFVYGNLHTVILIYSVVTIYQYPESLEKILENRPKVTHKYDMQKMTDYTRVERPYCLIYDRKSVQLPWISFQWYIVFVMLRTEIAFLYDWICQWIFFAVEWLVEQLRKQEKYEPETIYLQRSQNY